MKTQRAKIIKEMESAANENLGRQIKEARQNLATNLQVVDGQNIVKKLKSLSEYLLDEYQIPQLIDGATDIHNIIFMLATHYKSRNNPSTMELISGLLEEVVGYFEEEKNYVEGGKDNPEKSGISEKAPEYADIAKKLKEIYFK